MFLHNSPIRKVWPALSRILVAVALLALPLWADQAAAQAPIILDGVGSEWDPAWQITADDLDVYLTDLGSHPHDAPTYARSGYDAIGLWAHYQAADGRWYFRLDVDGRGGDSDSQTGTAGNPGVGTHGPDQGPLVVPPFTDSIGLGNSESYKLGFQCSSGGAGSTAELGPGEEILPGIVAPTTAGLVGQAAYGTTVPGVVEFGFDRALLFPSGSMCQQFWLSAQVGDNNDRVSDDQVLAAMVLGLDLAVLCPQAPIVVGQDTTFTLDYGIPASAAQAATDVILTVQMPSGTTFVSASDGGTQSGGVITWHLGSLDPGDSGDVTFTLHMAGPTSLSLTSEISCAEGLRYQATNQCPLQQNPAPTPIPDLPPVVPEPATITLLLAGLGGLTGYIALQRRARKRQ